MFIAPAFNLQALHVQCANFLVHLKMFDSYGRARVGIMDCSPPTEASICRKLGVPSNSYPHFYIFPAGNASVKGTGKRLFGREVQSHLVFPIIATLLQTVLPENSTGDVIPAVDEDAQIAVIPEEGGAEDDTEDYDAPPPPPRPPPAPHSGYDAPPARFAVRGRSGGGGGPALGPSDRRIKENIVLVGHSGAGLPLYTFEYITNEFAVAAAMAIADTNHTVSGTTRFKGTMAQDLLALGRDDAVLQTLDGFLYVDYSRTDVDFVVF
eukprot:SAG31_NODE_146_length_22601_cov_56.529192_4_plen_266_part_00